ncbi:multicopper oxidase-domain-containing protein [Chytriomyces cf. hyalinus JEL632]|nr:multicopper oxidase-domain-containing protein [Chytriomyces cf. hyalinus JEL632]
MVESNSLLSLDKRIHPAPLPKDANSKTRSFWFIATGIISLSLIAAITAAVVILSTRPRAAPSPPPSLTPMLLEPQPVDIEHGTKFVEEYPGHASTVSLAWNVTWIDSQAPDGTFARSVVGVNGTFPIPHIFAFVGDTVALNVTNSLNVSFTIHFQGTENDAHFDGTTATQCQIVPKSTFMYRMEVNKPGTFLVHGVGSGLETDGLATMLVVSPVPLNSSISYEEHNLFISDWFHQPYSVWSNAASLAPNAAARALEQSPYGALINYGAVKSMVFLGETTYRLRIACLAATSAFTFSLDGHDMTVEQVDGTLTNLTYNFRVQIIRSASQYAQQPLTLLPIQYEGAPLNAETFIPTTLPVAVSDTGFKALVEPESAQPNATVFLHLSIASSNYSDNAIRKAFNNTPYSAPLVPSLYTAASIDPQFQNDPLVYGAFSNAYVIPSLNTTVQLVIASNDTSTHPISLHGHTLHILYMSSTPYNETDFLNQTFSTTNTSIPRRDTAIVPAHGFIVVQFTATRAGAWLLTSQLANDAANGLVATFIVDAGAVRAGAGIPLDHAQLCSQQGVPVVGNADGNGGLELGLSEELNVLDVAQEGVIEGKAGGYCLFRFLNEICSGDGREYYECLEGNVWSGPVVCAVGRTCSVLGFSTKGDVVGCLETGARTPIPRILSEKDVAQLEQDALTVNNPVVGGVSPSAPVVAPTVTDEPALLEEPDVVVPTSKANPQSVPTSNTPSKMTGTQGPTTGDPCTYIINTILAAYAESNSPSDAVNLHNDIRDFVSLRDGKKRVHLVWDAAVADFATQDAKWSVANANCGSGQLAHSPSWGSGVHAKNLGWNNYVYAVKQFVYYNDGRGRALSHFSNMMSAGSSKVGCGIGPCGGHDPVIGCDYA